MIRKLNLLLLTLFCLTSSASAVNYYVSDDLYTYIHSGPGTQYKIIGSVNAGEHIKILQSNANFTQIKDSKGRSGWINSKFVSKRAGLKEHLPKLETQLTKLNAQLITVKDKADKDKIKFNEDLESKSKQVNELQNKNSKLNKELQKIQALNRNLNAKLDTQKNDLLMRWFTYGGMVAGAGLLLGLILPVLIPSRRRKTRW